jgi:hypothetical protein
VSLLRLRAIPRTPRTGCGFLRIASFVRGRRSSHVLRALCVFAVIAAAVAPATAAAAARKPPSTEIPPGRTLVIVGQDPATDDGYVAETGREPAGFMDYASLWHEPPRLAEELDAIAGHLSRHPGAAEQLGLDIGSPLWSTLAGEPQPPGTVDVVRGARDQQIDVLARWIKRLQAPVYLRIGYEFDLLGGQWGPAETYKAAYRHIVDRLRARGVRNAAYVWHSAGAFFRIADYSGAAGLVGTMDRSGGWLDPAVAGLAAPRGDVQPITAFYPGRDYVDYFAISFFGDACCFGRSSATARAVYLERTREILRQAADLGLPSMIGESTPAYVGFDGRDGLDWLQDYFALIEDFDLRATSLIVPDWPSAPGTWGQPFWNGYWPDARVHHYKAARTAWLAELDTPRYVEAGERLKAPERRRQRRRLAQRW